MVTSASRLTSMKGTSVSKYFITDIYVRIATHGSILDFQLRLKFGKFQLARWNLRDAVLCRDPHHPTTTA